jgi:hypothetical protein
MLLVAQHAMGDNTSAEIAATPEQGQQGYCEQ